jgi:hypothetical protein
VAHSRFVSGQIRDTGGANAFRNCRVPYFSDPARAEKVLVVRVLRVNASPRLSITSGLRQPLAEGTPRLA